MKIGNVWSLGEQGCRVYRSSIQVIPTTTWTPVVFDSVLYDPNGYWDGPPSAHRFTIQETGVFVLGANFRFDAGAANTRRGSVIRLNGVTTILNSIYWPGGVHDWGWSDHCVIRLIGGDQIEHLVRQDTGGNLNLMYYPVFSPHFWIQRIG